METSMLDFLQCKQTDTALLINPSVLAHQYNWNISRIIGKRLSLGSVETGWKKKQTGYNGVHWRFNQAWCRWMKWWYVDSYHDNVGQMCRAQSVDAAGAPDHRSTHVSDGDGERACGETEQEDLLGLGGTEDGGVGRTWAKGSNSKNKRPQHPAANHPPPAGLKHQIKPVPVTVLLFNSTSRT